MMDSFRSLQTQDYGILRKKENIKEEELFVFGYSCKIYEDYDKSLYVDQGKHLIPWLGDESLKIDRYDCRGALNDLLPYLPKSEGFDRRTGLSNEEKRIEHLCDQERYRALLTNEDEEVLYQEEELKRLQKALNNDKSYSEVAYTYNEETAASEEGSQKEIEEDEDDEPFIPPKQLDLPVGMKMPKSKKHHEIIEKTVFFISGQGAQMEILLKIKQADNPQFQFLSFDNELHPYYRLMLNAVKSQKYKPTPPPAPPVKETTEEITNDDAYLHPSLVQNNQSYSLPESAPEIPNISYKPSVDCAYSALVNRIQKTQNAGLLLDGIKKKEDSNDSGLPASSDTDKIRPSFANTSTASLPLSALSKSARRRRIRKEKNKAAAASFNIYYTEGEVIKQQDENEEDEDEEEEEEEEEEKEKKKQEAKSEDEMQEKYVTECNDESSAMVPVLKPVPAPVAVMEMPPSDVQLVIDKMASYVAKNGRTFEDVIRNKGDTRFSFVEKEHIYNPYYNQKVELYLQLENPEMVRVPVPSATTNDKSDIAKKELDSKKTNVKLVKSKKSSKPIPICFSIKKPKDQESLEIKSALPYEESEGDEEQGNEEGKEKCVDKNEDEVATQVENTAIDKLESSQSKPETNNTKKATDITLEKWAQERLRAKLMTAAKEKLAAKQKDKQLQAERRRRAAEFINLLHKENLVTKPSVPQRNYVSSKSNAKKSSTDVITIPSDSSSSNSDSVVSLSSEEGEKLKYSKRKSADPDSYHQKKYRKDSSYDERNEHKKPKRRSHLSSQARSPPHFKHSQNKYAKYDREKRSHSKKKKHYHYRSGSPSLHKKNHKDHHKSKRSKYSNENSIFSDSASSCDSISDISKRIA